MSKKKNTKTHTKSGNRTKAPTATHQVRPAAKIPAEEAPKPTLPPKEKPKPTSNKRTSDITQEPKPTVKKRREQQERLGDILRRVREHRGETIEDIADYLCIRVTYLRSLENSEYGKLPADAYVIGFLKTYANYLELDDKGAVNQYRHEMAGRRRKPQLTMPVPMSEGRAPTVALMVGGLIAALLVYAVWYWLWTPENNIAQEDPLLPGTVVEVPAEQNKIDKKEEPAPEKEAEKPREDSSMVLDDELTEKVLAATSPTSMGTIVIEATEEEAVKTVPISAKTKAKITATAKAHKEIILDLNDPMLADTKPLSPRIFGTKNKSYITITALQDSWVLVTDAKGLTVFDRTLKSGESYRVPRRKGLRLTTGNAKEISIKIFGKQMPKLKSSGKVARGITLHPTKLEKLLMKDE